MSFDEPHSARALAAWLARLDPQDPGVTLGEVIERARRVVAHEAEHPERTPPYSPPLPGEPNRPTPPYQAPPGGPGWYPPGPGQPPPPMPPPGQPYA